MRLEIKGTLERIPEDSAEFEQWCKERGWRPVPKDVWTLQYGRAYVPELRCYCQNASHIFTATTGFQMLLNETQLEQLGVTA